MSRMRPFCAVNRIAQGPEVIRLDLICNNGKSNTRVRGCPVDQLYQTKIRRLSNVDDIATPYLPTTEF